MDRDSLAQTRAAEHRSAAAPPEEDAAPEVALGASQEPVPRYVCLVDDAGRIVAVNPGWRHFCSSNGLPPDRVAEGADYLAICERARGPNRERARFFAAGLREVLAGAREAFSIEFGGCGEDAAHWYLATATRLAGAGAPQAVVSYQDITALRRTRDDLRQHRRHLRSILESLNDAVWSLVPARQQPGEYELLYMNPAAERLYGHPLQAFFADRDLWLKVIHPDDRERVRSHLPEFLRSGAADLEYRIVRPDGEVRWVRDRGRVVYAEDGSVQRLDGIVTDVTEHVRAGEALRETTLALRRLAAHLESVREDESGRIAREVHDELGGNLTMLKLGLASALERLGPRTAARPTLESLLGVAQSTIQIVKRISSTLRPPMLDTLGLVETIRWHINEFSQLSGLQVDVQLPEYVRLSQERSTAMYRVVQEALTNVARHAGARRVSVRAQKKQGELVMEISDDGRGISEDELRKDNSYGILGMRERSLYLGGEFSIHGEPGKGTTIRLRLPLSP